MHTASDQELEPGQAQERDYRAFSCDVIIFEIMKETENSCHVGVQRDRSFYGDLREMSDILIMHASNMC